MTQNLGYKPAGNSWCYNNNSKRCEEGGRLYPWQTAVSVCPPGWELPSKEDFDSLVAYLSKYGENGTNVFFLAIYEGGESGFNAEFAGRRNRTGAFELIESQANWWSSSENEVHNAWRMMINKLDWRMIMIETHKDLSASVRCVRMR